MSGLNLSDGSFLPDEYVKGKNEQKANVVILLLFGLVLTGTAAFFALKYQEQRSIASRVKQVRSDFEEESSKIAQLQALEQQRLDLLSRAEVVNALIDRVPRSSLVSELTKGLPRDVSVELVTLKSERVRAEEVAAPAPVEKGAVSNAGEVKAKAAPRRVMPPAFNSTVEVQGLAVLNNDVADYVSALKQSALFSSVELQSISPTLVEDRELRRFRVVLGLKKAADVRQVPGAVETTLLNEDEARALTQAPVAGE
jgi:Tfp pilus assembly protein PilN